MHLKVFLSSPGDVATERSIAHAVVAQLQYDPFVRGRATFDVIAWDDPSGGAPIKATVTPQESINQGMTRPQDCDIVVVILWSRIGTPLPFPEYQRADGERYLSGTDWEFDDAVTGAAANSRPDVLVYRRTSTVSLDPDDPLLEDKLGQYRGVQEFFARMHDPETGVILGGHKKYDSPDDFRKILDHDLRSLVRDWLAGRPAMDEASESPSLPPLWVGSPFPGLRAFTPADAPIYFGRGRESDELERRTQASPFVGVVGASGSGKSSLVGAGLLPRLAAAEPDWVVPDFDRDTRLWSGLRFSPGELGADPFVAAAARLAPWSEVSPRELAAELRADPEGIARHLPAPHSMLFIDQFEELFTVAEPDLARPFVQMIGAAVRSGICLVVVTLRADYYHRCLELPELGQLLEQGQLPLTAPSDTLLEMIVRPADRAGIQFEEGLPERILHDTGRDPEALPLLAYTLDELYHVAQSGTLSHESYDRLGRVQGAIGTRAEQVFSRLGAETQAGFSLVFRDLVKVDDSGRTTRRRALLDEFGDSEPARHLIEAFTEARLLSQSKDDNNRPVVYVAHEALFASWDRLARWINLAREDLLVEQQVTRAAEEWVQQGRDDVYRWPHERLVRVYDMVNRLDLDLDADTAAFVEPEYHRIFPVLRDPDVQLHRKQNAMDRLVAIGADAIPGLLEMLGDPLEDARHSAALVLARQGEPAVAGLIAALAHRDADARLEAVGALRQIGASESIVALAPTIHDPDQRVRSAAVGALAAIGGTEALEALGAAVADAATDDGWLAAGALGTFGPEAIPYLLAVDDGDTERAESARRALAAIGASGVQQLIAGVQSDEERIRVHAAAVLANLDRPDFSDDLVALLSHQDAGVRWHACELAAGLAARTAPAAVRQALLSRLTDEEPMVRASAAQALGAVGDETAIADLLGAFDDANEDVRWAAVDALALSRGAASRELLRLMRTAGPATPIASAALRKCADLSLVEELGTHRDWVRDRVCEVLSGLGETVVPGVVTLLASPDENARDAASRTLAALGDAAVPSLVNELENGSAESRCAAARALGWMATSMTALADPSRQTLAKALPALEQLLKFGNSAERQAAVDALARLGSDALPVAWRGLESASEEVRESASQVVSRVGTAAVPGLFELLRREPSPAHETLIACLRSMPTPAAILGLAELGVPVS